MSATQQQALQSDISPDIIAKLRHIHPEEVAIHNIAKSCWVTLNGYVYDITSFLPDHPGGEELILQYGGHDISQAMADPSEHTHSHHAYRLLNDSYLIGILDKDMEFDINTINPDDLNLSSSLLAHRKDFIDVTKPMLIQLWYANYSKEYYLEQVHIPRHIRYSAPIFGGPLEYITLTPWYAVPIFWAPLYVIMWWLSAHWCENGYFFTLSMIPVGLLLWTFIEYSVHRFVFHIDALLPDNRISLMIHFLMHGIHHYLPMDRNRLVMPPTLSVFLGFCIWSFFSLFLPQYLVWSIACGVLPGYVMYDLIHYYLHHGRPHNSYLRTIKTYHIDHHYKEANLGFGITNKLWDYVFGTLLY